MRLGCFGCLFVVVGVLIIAVVALGVIFLSTNIFTPPDVRPSPFSRGDGYSAQQKLYEVVQRQAGTSNRRDPIVITQAEANAFLSRHLEQSGLPLSPMIVKFSRGQVQVQGQTPLRNLAKGPPLAQILPYVSDRRLDQPVWVTLQGRVKLEGTGAGRRGKVEIEEFALGKQHLGSLVLWVLMGPSGGGLLEWPVPAGVADVRVGEGQVSILTR